MTLVPNAGQFGVTEITVTVRDASGATAGDTFLLTVESLDDPPRLRTAPEGFEALPGSTRDLRAVADGAQPSVTAGAATARSCRAGRIRC